MRISVFRSFRRGTSIPEVLAVSFSLLMLITGLVSLAISTGNGWSFGTSKMTADNSASLTLQAWAKDIRYGRLASTDTTNTILTVQFPATNSQGDFDRNNPGTLTSVTYSLSGGNLVRTQGTSTTILGTKITSVLFTVAGPEVTLQLTARQQNGTRSGVTTLKSQVYLRNEPSQ